MNFDGFLNQEHASALKKSANFIEFTPKMQTSLVFVCKRIK